MWRGCSLSLNIWFTFLICGRHDFFLIATSMWEAWFFLSKFYFFKINIQSTKALLCIMLFTPTQFSLLLDSSLYEWLCTTSTDTMWIKYFTGISHPIYFHFPWSQPQGLKSHTWESFSGIVVFSVKVLPSSGKGATS